MKRFFLIAGLLVTSLTIALPAWAEMLQGTVAGIDPGGRSIRLTRIDQGRVEELKVNVKEEAQLNGIQSLDELKLGDNVVVNADKNLFTRAWNATSVEKSEVSQQESVARSEPVSTSTASDTTAAATPAAEAPVDSSSAPSADPTAQETFATDAGV